LGAVIAEKFAAEGSNVGINYASNAEAANTLAERLKKEYGVKTAVFQGDAGVLADCKYLIHETIKAFGGIDVIIGNAVSFFLFDAGSRSGKACIMWLWVDINDDVEK
jgi:NAD(P)-dependent dehydrogenase (short-subunit alcohol dehydrogenase family)